LGDFSRAEIGCFERSEIRIEGLQGLNSRVTTRQTLGRIFPTWQPKINKSSAIHAKDFHGKELANVTRF
jgi:hypothetical protein